MSSPLREEHAMPGESATVDGAGEPAEPAHTGQAGRWGAGWLRPVIALRQRNFRLFWFGQSISAIGTWMDNIGQAWLVWQLTHSALQLGVVGALEATPVLLFALFGGVFADRWPKRRVLLVTQTVAMAQALCLWGLVVTQTVQIWEVYALALIFGLASSLGRPTSQAFLVEMVGRKDLPNAVALASSLTTFARVVGPALAGVVIARAGVSPLFLLNGLSFLAVIAALALMDRRALHAQARRDGGGGTTAEADASVWQSLREGLAYVWTTRTVLLVIVVVGFVLLFGSNFNVVLPLFAANVLSVGAQGFGLLSAALGVGSLVGTLWLAWGNRQPSVGKVLAAALVFGAMELEFATSTLFPLSLALLVGVGVAEMACAAQAMTYLQSAAPDHLRGRVMSVCILFFDGSLPAGYVLTGWLAHALGAPIALAIGATCTLLVGGAGWIWHRSGIARVV